MATLLTCDAHDGHIVFIHDLLMLTAVAILLLSGQVQVPAVARLRFVPGRVYTGSVVTDCTASDQSLQRHPLPIACNVSMIFHMMYHNVQSVTLCVPFAGLQEPFPG